MKTVAAIARILLALLFLVFGFNGFFHYLPQPPMPPSPATDFLTVMMTTHYIVVVCGAQVLGGFLLLINRFVPLGLVILAAVIVNILAFHLLMAPASILPGLVATILWIIVACRFRSALSGIFECRPGNAGSAAP